MIPAQIERRSVHVRDGAAGLANQQNSRSHVPRIEAEFPKKIEAATGDICEIDCGSSRAAHTMRKHRELIVEMHVHVLMPLAGGEAGGGERILDPFRAGDVNAAVIKKRTRARFGAEYFVACRIDNYAADQLTRALQCECHVEHRKSVREVGGAVERIDVPAIFGRSRVPAALLRDDGVRGEVALQTLYNKPLTGAVGVGYQVVFALELEGVVVLATALHGSGNDGRGL